MKKLSIISLFLFLSQISFGQIREVILKVPGGATTDTSSISSRIDGKVNNSDTASMLSPYAKSIKVLSDSIDLAVAINAKRDSSFRDSTLIYFPVRATLDGKGIYVDTFKLRELRYAMAARDTATWTDTTLTDRKFLDTRLGSKVDTALALKFYLSSLKNLDKLRYDSAAGKWVNYTYDSSFVGGNSSSSSISFKTTTGIGSTGAFHFLTGTNGSNESLTIFNSGSVGINLLGASPSSILDVRSAATLAIVNIQANTPTSGTSAGIVFQASRGVVGWDGAISGMKIGTSDNGKPVVFSNSTTTGTGEYARFSGTGQLALGTTSPNTSARIDITSTTQGILFPRMTTAQRNAISSPATNLLLSNTTENKVNSYNGTNWISVGGFSGSYSTTASATSTFTVTIGQTLTSTSYRVSVTPTVALGAAPFYVTNKTTTTFDVTYLSPLTGTETFDWIISQQ